MIRSEPQDLLSGFSEVGKEVICIDSDDEETTQSALEASSNGASKQSSPLPRSQLTPDTRKRQVKFRAKFSAAMTQARNSAADREMAITKTTAGPTAKAEIVEIIDSEDEELQAAKD